MMQIGSAATKISRVSCVAQPVVKYNDVPAELSPLKARLVQRTTTRYEKGLKRLSEI